MNQQNLLGYSNQEAMDILKQAMSDQHIVQLVVARRTDVTPPSMAALGEEPEEVGVVFNTAMGCGIYLVYLQASSFCTWKHGQLH